jgi:hypothetical protein
MSKFLLNLLLQNSKALVNSKIQFLIQKFLFSYFWPGHLPYFPAQPRPTSSLPVWPNRPVACSNYPIRPSPAPLVRFGRRLLRLSDSAVASLSLTGGPTLSMSPGSSSSSDNGRAATAPWPPSASQLHASGATGPLPPRLHFPSLKSPLKPSPVFNGVKAINAGIKLPGHPSSAFPQPPIKGEHLHRVSPHLSPLLFPSLHA